MGAVAGAVSAKVVAVTGASSGSGRGIAKRFLEEGASVVMLARGWERLDQVAGALGPRAIPIAADVGNPDSVRDAFGEIGERFGKLDVLINVGGGQPFERRPQSRALVEPGQEPLTKSDGRVAEDQLRARRQLLGLWWPKMASPSSRGPPVLVYESA